MSGETNKNLKKLVCAGIVALALAGCARQARGTLSNSSSIVEEGLEYYIRIDEGVYDLGETIEMLHRLTNVGDQTLNVCDLSLSYTVSFELTRPEGDILLAPAFITVPRPPGFPNIITLNPGEYAESRWYITLCEWGIDGQVVEEPFATVGHYSITSEYDNSFASEGPLRLEPDALDFVIIPEPASIALLGLGLASLLVRRKGKAGCSN